MSSVRVLRLSGPLDLVHTLGLHARGRSDPSMSVTRREVLRATRNSGGAVALHLRSEPGRLEAVAWGPGAEQALETLPDLVGEPDSFGLPLGDPVIRRLHKRTLGLRIGRTSAVVEALVPAVLEQKITGAEARRVHRALVLAHGEPAPGPLGLRLPPSPETLARLPYWSFHRAGLERRRAAVIQGACRVAGKLERACDLAFEDAYGILSSLPGIGPWTVAEVGARAFGDPDAVPVGDLHIPSLVSWALAGDPRGNDERMLELLAPFAGERGRVIRMIEAAALRPPRLGPRAPARRIATL